MKLLLATTTLVLALVLAGCASPANFAGNYTIATTNGANSCGFMNWTDGSMTSGTPVVITQATGDSHASMQIMGLAGVYIAALSGSATIPGTISGSTGDFPATGTAAGNMGTCHYFVNLDIEAHLTGDTLTGTISLTPATNHAADCGVLETCHNEIAFNGTRPPTM